MSKMKFNKEEFKKEVVSNVRSLYRKTMEEATKQQVFQAVAYAVKDYIIDRWIATHQEFEKQDAKTVTYVTRGEFENNIDLQNKFFNLVK